MIECTLASSERQTAFGPLCALGHLLCMEKVLEPLSGVRIAHKTVVHSPTQKLLDALMGILTGCAALYEINCRVRPDLPLQRAFGRERLAEQSTIQKTLNSFTQENIDQLRRAVESIHWRHLRLSSHDYYEGEMLVLEVDLTGLRASRRAEHSTKGYFSGERNATGRQLVRVSTPNYGEVLFEKLYAGNTNSCEVLKETLGEVERILGLAEEREKRGSWGSAGGKGIEEGPAETADPSSVGEGGCRGHRSTFPSRWMAYYLAQNLDDGTYPLWNWRFSMGATVEIPKESNGVVYRSIPRCAIEPS